MQKVANSLTAAKYANELAGRDWEVIKENIIKR